MNDPGAADRWPAALPDSIWLVGLSASGKSTVGPLVAEKLRYSFIDMDSRIEARSGLAVPEIFASGGEDRFREIEAEVSDELLAESRIVVAAGGGWMARTDIRRGPPGCVRVWLRVSPVAASARLAGATETRPLLAGSDPVGTLERLLRSREAAYSEAELHVDTTGRAPADVASEVVAALERLNG